MQNTKAIFSSYFKEFYGLRKNIKLLSFKTLIFVISAITFISFFVLYVLHGSKLTAYVIHDIDTKISKFISADKITSLYFITLISAEILMIVMSVLIQKEKQKTIKNRLYDEFKLEVDAPINRYKEKWLCRKFKCYPHELSDIAHKIYINNSTIKSLKKQEPFTLTGLSELIYNKEAKTRINSWLIALLSLMVGIFISKQKNISIELLFSFLNMNFGFFDIIVSIGAIILFWFFRSIFMFLKEFFTTESDIANIAIVDMIKLSQFQKW